MAEKEQVKPLASISNQLHSDNDIFRSPAGKLRRNHSYIKCCGCFTAVLLILAVIGIILGFTVFHIRSPDIKIESLTLLNDAVSSDDDVVLVATVSVKNPNVASFKYYKTNTEVYYGGAVIGEGETPAGEAKGKSTTRVNVTVEIDRKKVAEVPSLAEDFGAGALNISSYTVVPGKVKIIGSIKKEFEVKMNCSMTYYTRNQRIQGQDCNQNVEVSD